MHVEMSIDQMFSLRPAMGLSEYKGPLDNLFLTGASNASGRWHYGRIRTQRRARRAEAPRLRQAMTPDARRYARQITLPDVGTEGQQRLAGASVFVVGAGGLGAPALHHLVASGVGTVAFADFDRVDVSNLHRQTLYASDDVGRLKAEAAADRLRAVNPEVDVRPHAVKLTAANAAVLIGPHDVVLDGSDSFATRYVVNDASVATGTPTVFASVSQFSGQASVFGAENGPCYRCLFPSPPPPGLVPNCEDGGVLGVAPSLLGTIQAAEALKWVLGIGTPLVGRLLLVDLLDLSFREITVDRDPECATCGRGASEPATDTAPGDVTADELRRRLAGASPPLLLDVRQPEERAGGPHRRAGDPAGRGGGPGRRNP